MKESHDKNIGVTPKASENVSTSMFGGLSGAFQALTGVGNDGTTPQQEQRDDAPCSSPGCSPSNRADMTRNTVHQILQASKTVPRKQGEEISPEEEAIMNEYCERLLKQDSSGARSSVDGSSLRSTHSEDDEVNLQIMSVNEHCLLSNTLLQSTCSSYSLNLCASAYTSDSSPMKAIRRPRAFCEDEEDEDEDNGNDTDNSASAGATDKYQVPDQRSVRDVQEYLYSAIQDHRETFLEPSCYDCNDCDMDGNCGMDADYLDVTKDDPPCSTRTLFLMPEDSLFSAFPEGSITLTSPHPHSITQVDGEVCPATAMNREISNITNNTADSRESTRDTDDDAKSPTSHQSTSSQQSVTDKNNDSKSHTSQQSQATSASPIKAVEIHIEDGEIDVQWGEISSFGDAAFSSGDYSATSSIQSAEQSTMAETSSQHDLDDDNPETTTDAATSSVTDGVGVSSVGGTMDAMDTSGNFSPTSGNFSPTSDVSHGDADEDGEETPKHIPFFYKALLFGPSISISEDESISSSASSYASCNTGSSPLSITNMDAKNTSFLTMWSSASGSPPSSMRGRSRSMTGQQVGQQDTKKTTKTEQPRSTTLPSLLQPQWTEPECPSLDLLPIMPEPKEIPQTFANSLHQAGTNDSDDDTSVEVTINPFPVFSDNDEEEKMAGSKNNNTIQSIIDVESSDTAFVTKDSSSPSPKPKPSSSAYHKNFALSPTSSSEAGDAVEDGERQVSNLASQLLKANEMYNDGIQASIMMAPSLSGGETTSLSGGETTSLSGGETTDTGREVQSQPEKISTKKYLEEQKQLRTSMAKLLMTLGALGPVNAKQADSEESAQDICKQDAGDENQFHAPASKECPSANPGATEADKREEGGSQLEEVEMFFFQNQVFVGASAESIQNSTRNPNLPGRIKMENEESGDSDTSESNLSIVDSTTCDSYESNIIIEDVSNEENQAPASSFSPPDATITDSTQPLLDDSILAPIELTVKKKEHEFISALIKKVGSYDAQIIANKTKSQLLRTAMSLDRGSSHHGGQNEQQEASPSSHKPYTLSRQLSPSEKSLITMFSSSSSASSSSNSSGDEQSSKPPKQPSESKNQAIAEIQVQAVASSDEYDHNNERVSLERSVDIERCSDSEKDSVSEVDRMSHSFSLHRKNMQSIEEEMHCESEEAQDSVVAFNEFMDSITPLPSEGTLTSQSHGGNESACGGETAALEESSEKEPQQVEILIISDEIDLEIPNASSENQQNTRSMEDEMYHKSKEEEGNIAMNDLANIDTLSADQIVTSQSQVDTGDDDMALTESSEKEKQQVEIHATPDEADLVELSNSIEEELHCEHKEDQKGALALNDIDNIPPFSSDQLLTSQSQVGIETTSDDDDMAPKESIEKEKQEMETHDAPDETDLVELSNSLEKETHCESTEDQENIIALNDPGNTTPLSSDQLLTSQSQVGIEATFGDDEISMKESSEMEKQQMETHDTPDETDLVELSNSLEEATHCESTDDQEDIVVLNDPGITTPLSSGQFLTSQSQVDFETTFGDDDISMKDSSEMENEQMETHDSTDETDIVEEFVEEFKSILEEFNSIVKETDCESKEDQEGTVALNGDDLTLLSSDQLLASQSQVAIETTCGDDDMALRDSSEKENQQVEIHSVETGLKQSDSSSVNQQSPKSIEEETHDKSNSNQESRSLLVVDNITPLSTAQVSASQSQDGIATAGGEASKEVSEENEKQEVEIRVTPYETDLELSNSSSVDQKSIRSSGEEEMHNESYEEQEGDIALNDTNNMTQAQILASQSHDDIEIAYGNDDRVLEETCKKEKKKVEIHISSDEIDLELAMGSQSSSEELPETDSQDSEESTGHSPPDLTLASCDSDSVCVVQDAGNGANIIPVPEYAIPDEPAESSDEPQRRNLSLFESIVSSLASISTSQGHPLASLREPLLSYEGGYRRRSEDETPELDGDDIPAGSSNAWRRHNLSPFQRMVYFLASTPKEHPLASLREPLLVHEGEYRRRLEDEPPELGGEDAGGFRPLLSSEQHQYDLEQGGLSSNGAVAALRDESMCTRVIQHCCNALFFRNIVGLLLFVSIALSAAMALGLF